jgi:hypothetical protein
MKKVLDWLKENKEEIVEASAIGLFLLVLGLMLFIVMLVAMTDDLVGVLEEKQVQLDQVTMERNRLYLVNDSIIQTYEDAIPKQQYIDDIEYLESVIRELRESCQNDTYNNN